MAKRERDRCGQAREEYRTEQENLRQLTRSTDLSEGNLRVAAGQARSGFVQTVATVLALIAAVVAAVAAMVAVYYAKRSADADNHTLDLTKEGNETARLASERQLRAYLGVRSACVTIRDNEAWSFKLKNYGQTPAKDVVVRVTTTVNGISQSEPHTFGLIDPDFSWIGQIRIPRDAPVFIEDVFTGRMTVDIEIDYDDISGGRWTRSQSFHYAQGTPQIGEPGDGKIHLHLSSSSERSRETETT